MSEIFESWGGLSLQDDEKWNSLFDEYVPAEGKADTVGGEILRAMSRIVYRYYNDGDTVDEYCGSAYNHCKGADIYLSDTIPGYHSLEGYWGDEYEKEMCARLKFILDYLLEHPELFTTPNDEDYLELSPYEPYVDDDEEDEYWDDQWDDEEDEEDEEDY